MKNRKILGKNFIFIVAAILTVLTLVLTGRVFISRPDSFYTLIIFWGMSLFFWAQFFSQKYNNKLANEKSKVKTLILDITPTFVLVAVHFIIMILYENIAFTVFFYILLVCFLVMLGVGIFKLKDNAVIVRSENNDLEK